MTQLNKQAKKHCIALLRLPEVTGNFNTKSISKGKQERDGYTRNSTHFQIHSPKK